MATKVCSREALYERLFRQFHADYMLVRATEAAKDKVASAGLKNVKEALERVLKLDQVRSAGTKVDFEAEEDIAKVGDAGFETQLLEAVTNNADASETEEPDFVGYPPWFAEWAVALARALRIIKYRALSIPLESRGLLLFCSSDDSKDAVSELLGSPESPLFRAVIVFGENNSKAFLSELRETYREGINHFVVNSDSAPVEQCLITEEFASFVVRIAEACAAQAKLELSSQKKKKSVPHISSKAGKARPTEADIVAMRSIILDMNEELQGDIPTGYIDMVCSSTDYEINGIAYVYRALLHLKVLSTKQEVGKKAADGKNEVAEAIGDLERAITVFLKYDLKWHALLASIFMATIGKEIESRKMGTISATMELKSKSDYARAALSLELCAFHAEKRRRKMFHLVMAGQLYQQAGLMNLTKRCFMLALPLYKERGWNVASEFLHGTLSRCEPLFCIDALNGLSDSCELLNCYTRTKGYNETFFKSSWYSPDREMTHLRRLMKLSVTKYTEEDIRDKNAMAVVACAYSAYPALLYGKNEIAPLGESTPWLVKVPLVLLRNLEGVHGRNCELLLTGDVGSVSNAHEECPYNTADDFDLQEVAITNRVKQKAELDPAWKICYDFISDYGTMSYRLDTDCSGYSLPKQKTKPTFNYLLGAESLIKLELVNPLHINIHCDDFHLLIEQEATNWWEKAVVMSMESEEPEHAHQEQQQSQFIYLVEGERRVVFLKFKISKPGKFRVIGLAWKLFGCVSCWSPLYLSGQRTTKGAPLRIRGTEELSKYIADRVENAGLSLSIHEMYPQVKISVTKVTSLPGNMCPLNSNDENFCVLKNYFAATDDDDVPDSFNNEGYLSMGEAISGEYVITRLSVKNVGSEAIDTVTLNVKTSGTCSVMNYPLAYREKSGNISVSWEDMAKCNLGSITGNKTYQVTLKDENGDLIAPDGVLSIYLLMVPCAEDEPNILCIQGRLTLSSKNYKVNGRMSFWRFYSTGVGLNVSYKYEHSLSNMLQCTIVNNSSTDIRSICFFNSLGARVLPAVSSPTISNQKMELTLKRNCRVTTAIPYTPGESNFKLRWECNGAFGLINSGIEIQTKPCVLVKIRTEQSSVKYTGGPAIVRVEYVFENPTSITIPSIQVEAKPKSGWGDEHNWFYVGILTGVVPDIPPNESRHISFYVVLPLPGMYIFSYNDITMSYAQNVSINPCNELMIPVEA